MLEKAVMEGESHILHHIEEVSNLISLSREYEANTMTRNATRCNNCYYLFNLSFILKISIFSKVHLPSQTIWCSFFLRKLSVGFSQKSSITDVRLDFKYVSTFTLKPFTSRHWNTGLVSSGASLTSWGEGTSLALAGDGDKNDKDVHNKMLYRVDVLHWTVAPNLFLLGWLKVNLALLLHQLRLV